MAQHREAQHLVLAVGNKSVEGIEHPLGATGVGVGPAAIDGVEEVEHAPPGARLDALRSVTPKRLPGNVRCSTL